MNEKEKEVYEHLLDKLKEEDDADIACGWASALDRFCDAVSTVNLHITRNGG